MTKSCEDHQKSKMTKMTLTKMTSIQKSGSPLLVHTRERYKEYDGCYLGHYAQWFFWFFFTIGIFVVAGGVGMMIAQGYGK